jgi:hypothetical protein
MNNPKVFMGSHIIEMAWGALPNRNNQQVFVADFDLVPLGNAADGTPRCRLESYTQNAHGLPKAHGANSHRITAYWLPYEAQKYCETTLGNAANYMFTATLTGCTIAVGSGNTPKVSHINHQANDAIDHPRILQKYHKHYRFDVGARAIHKDDYWHNAAVDQAHTIVGIRRDHGWKFYMNSRDGRGVNAQALQGCRKLHQT